MKSKKFNIFHTKEKQRKQRNSILRKKTVDKKTYENHCQIEYASHHNDEIQNVPHIVEVVLKKIKYKQF